MKKSKELVKSEERNSDGTFTHGHSFGKGRPFGIKPFGGKENFQARAFYMSEFNKKMMENFPLLLDQLLIDLKHVEEKVRIAATLQIFQYTLPKIKEMAMDGNVNEGGLRIVLERNREMLNMLEHDLFNKDKVDG